MNMMIITIDKDISDNTCINDDNDGWMDGPTDWMDGWNEAYIRSLYVHRVSNTFELLAASFCFFLARKRIKKKGYR